MPKAPPRPAKPGKPGWRKAFDTIEKQTAPHLEQFVRTEVFAQGVAAVIRIEAQLRRQSERNLRRIWHLWNLPAATDVRALSERVSVLQRQVREIAERFERDAGSSGGPDA